MLGVLLPMLPLAAAEWRWRHSRFCKHCGARTKKPRDAAGLIWCPACHGLADPAALLVEPAGTMTIGGWRYFNHVEPVLESLNLIMLMAIKDSATEIGFEPGHDSFEIRLVVENEVYDLEPPPAWVHVPMTQTVKAIAGIGLAMSDRRQGGHIDIFCGGHLVPAAVVAEPTEFGQKVTIRFLTQYWLPNPAMASGRA